MNDQQRESLDEMVAKSAQLISVFYNGGFTSAIELEVTRQNIIQGKKLAVDDICLVDAALRILQTGICVEAWKRQNG